MSDAQHGARGATATHANATVGTDGFMSAIDKTRLDGIATGATNTPLSSTAPVNVTKAAASAGAATEASKQDHKHDVTTAAPAATGVSTASAEGAATSLARSDHSHQSNTAPANVTKAAASIGTSGEPARADHKHDITTAAPSTGIGGSNAEGAATSLARSDHNHALRETSGPTDLTIGAIANGQYLLRSGATIIGGSPGGGVFGADYQAAASEGPGTTTNAVMQDKTTLTTGALTGVYRVGFFCEIQIDTANRRHQCRLYNVTDAAELCYNEDRPSLTSLYQAAAGFCNVTFTGAAKTFKIQFASQDGTATVTIRRARIELWRVS